MTVFNSANCDSDSMYMCIYSCTRQWFRSASDISVTHDPSIDPWFTCQAHGLLRATSGIGGPTCHLHHGLSFSSAGLLYRQFPNVFSLHLIVSVPTHYCPTTSRLDISKAFSTNLPSYTCALSPMWCNRVSFELTHHLTATSTSFRPVSL